MEIYTLKKGIRLATSNLLRVASSHFRETSLSHAFGHWLKSVSLPKTKGKLASKLSMVAELRFSCSFLVFLSLASKHAASSEQELQV